MTDQIALENSKPIVMERCKNIVRAVLTKFIMIQSPEEEYAKELEPYKEQAAEWMKTVDEIPEIVDMARLLDGPKLFLKALDCDETDPLYQFKFPYTLERMGKYYSEKVVRGVSEKKYSILADFVEPEGAEYEIPYEIEGDVFLKCNKEARKETVVVPSWIRVIDSFAFSGCEDIRHVILPDTVEEIRYGAFRYSGIKDIVVPDRVTRMENEVFEECRALKSKVKRKGIIELKERTFRICQRLERLELPEGLEKIGHRAFEECYSLKTVWVGGKEYRIRDPHAPVPVRLVYDCLEEIRNKIRRDYENGLMDEFEYIDYGISGDGYSY